MTVVAFSLAVCGTSILAEFLGALTGVGGGVVIVPVLCLLFHLDLRYAIGASLVSVIATSSGAVAAYVREGFSSQQCEDLQLLLAEKVTPLRSGSIEAIPLLLDGDPKQVVPKIAEQYEPSFLVLGTQGGDWIEQGVIGSVVERILRSTRWPTMTVGSRVRPATSGTLPFRRILHGPDLTAAAAKAAVFAVSFAKATRAEIDILNVVEHGAVHHPGRLGEIRKQFYNALDAVFPRKLTSSAIHGLSPRSAMHMSRSCNT
jgi:nucleotide-binding universal stress UspA family protein